MIGTPIVALFFGYVASVIRSLAPRSRNYEAIFFEHGAGVHYVPIERHRWLQPFLPITCSTTIDSVVLFDPKHDGATLVALVPHINEFDSFRQLSIQQSAISDDDLRELSAINNLERLELVGSNFSDAGLVHVGQLNYLKELVISKTKITTNGLQQLRDALPYCAIVADIACPPALTKPEPQLMKNTPNR